MLVSRPAQGLAMACDGPRYTNMYETRIETTNLTRALVVAAPGRPSWVAHPVTLAPQPQGQLTGHEPARLGPGRTFT